MAKTKKKQPGRRAVVRGNAARRLSKRRETPADRLRADGASSPRNINRRLQWLAIEWGIAAPPKVGRTMSEALSDYCQRYRISYDWMLGGCLNGLKRMVDERRARHSATMRTADIMARYAQLLPEQKAILTAEIHRILEERDQ